MKLTQLLFLPLLGCSLPALADVNVTAPLNGSTVSSPFALAATASPCASQPVGSMGYSLDNSSQTTIIAGTSINAQVTSSPGQHVLHVKSWGHHGEACDVQVPVNVITGSVPGIPVGATVASKVQALPNWHAVKDPGTGTGIAQGSITPVAAPSMSGAARAFASTYSNSAGERFYVSFGVDRAATNFVYDVWVNIASSSAPIGNLDFEMNQVIPNGETVIYAVRCDSASGTWDYTENAGTPEAPQDLWIQSAAACNPANWTPDTWHHVQASYQRDDSGNVTYQSVWLDGAQQDINATVPSAFALGWNSVLLTNFQLDGSGPSGTATVYLDNLSVYRWTNTIDSPVTLVPSTATAVTDIQGLHTWSESNDKGMGRGTSTGASSIVTTPSLSGDGREFLTTYTNAGGERYHVSFGSDTSAHNFLYDGWIYLSSPSNTIANLELDMNQVIANGDTVIYGVQCNGGTGTWDYTENQGTPDAPNDHWLHSKAACNPREWTPDTWHHVQFTYARDDAGNVTYKSIWLDGVENDLNVTVPSAFSLGWGRVLLTNFQVDGVGMSGSETAYLDNLTIYRW